MWRGGGGTLLNPKYPPAVPAGGYNNNKCMQAALWIITKEFSEKERKYSRLTVYEDSL